MKLPGSSASFGPPPVIYFPGTQHILWAFPYLPTGEAPDGRLATSHGIGMILEMNIVDTTYYVVPGIKLNLKKRKIYFFPNLKNTRNIFSE